MRTMSIVVTMVGIMLHGSVRAQILDLDQHRFSADTRVLSAEAYLDRETVATLRRTGMQLPDPVAVGSIDGVQFQYRSNAVAIFATMPGADWRQLSRQNGWAAECTIDAIDDTPRCFLSRNDLGALLTPEGHLHLSVGANHYPGSAVAIRIDQAVAHRGDEGGFAEPLASQLVAELRVGESVTTRYQRWPYQVNVDDTMNLFGFDEALSFLHWAMAAIQ